MLKLKKKEILPLLFLRTTGKKKTFHMDKFPEYVFFTLHILMKFKQIAHVKNLMRMKKGKIMVSLTATQRISNETF